MISSHRRIDSPEILKVSDDPMIGYKGATLSSFLPATKESMLNERVARGRAALLSFPKPGYPLRATARLSLFLALAVVTHQFAIGAITIVTQNNINLPEIEVSHQSCTVYSEVFSLNLQNPNTKDGWVLTGEVLNGYLQGQESGETIPATLIFKSITWKRGGNGSTSGITVHADGRTIEADPGFGRGIYQIQFQIRYDIPAFPRADFYYGISNFSIQ